MTVKSADKADFIISFLKFNRVIFDITSMEFDIYDKGDLL